tara:strand:- start:120 stop:911 length:792 start_codon:yes stop_codon:yes gene_type:complete
MNEVEQFQRIKRYLGFFAGVLLLNTFVGIEKSDSAAVFSVGLKSDALIDVLLFVIVAFYFLRMLNFWTLQDEMYRRKLQYKLDDFGHLLIAAISMIAAIYMRFMADIDAALYESLRYFVPFILGVLGSLVAAISMSLASSLRWSTNKQASKKVYEVRDAILNGEWYLMFANSGSGKLEEGKNYKKLVFSDDGEFAEGSNHNEKFWRLEGEFLEILNKSEVLFSRFRFDPKLNMFFATDDSDVLALPRQRIVRDIEQWNEDGRP